MFPKSLSIFLIITAPLLVMANLVLVFSLGDFTKLLPVPLYILLFIRAKESLVVRREKKRQNIPKHSAQLKA
jgi:hypothetical protein